MPDVKETPPGKTFGYDLIVGVLAVALIGFLLVTIGIRRDKERLEELCQARLQALAYAEQSYLTRNQKYTDELEQLRPYLDPRLRRMPLVCPITRNPFQARVQGDRYKIVAPGTDFSINTGDPSW